MVYIFMVGYFMLMTIMFLGVLALVLAAEGADPQSGY